MTRPLRIEFPGAFYHITARGNERKAIFKSRRDRERFLEYLESATERYGTVIHVYCLMDNHYHLLLETPLGNLSQIMHHINGAYTTYFNIKRSRSGHLFQGRYKAILVDADEYAKELSRYIHLNPIRAGLEEDPDDYLWSSCRFYTGKENAPGWLKREFILGYFGTKVSSSLKEYRFFIESALEEKNVDPLSERLHPVILGRQDFVDGIKTNFLRNREPDRDLPDLRKPISKIDMVEIEKAVERVFATDGKRARQVKVYFGHRYSGLKLKEIGMRFGLSESGVTQASRRVQLRIKNDKEFSRMINKVTQSVKV